MLILEQYKFHYLLNINKLKNIFTKIIIIY